MKLKFSRSARGRVIFLFARKWARREGKITRGYNTIRVVAYLNYRTTFNLVTVKLSYNDCEKNRDLCGVSETVEITGGILHSGA